VLPGQSFDGADSRGGRTDPQGHGTKMAGVIAARGGGENKALGIAPRARILPVAVPTGGQTGSIGEAIRWAVDHDAKVINLSLGRPGDEPLLPGEAEALRYAMGKDVVVVVDAGNVRQLPTGNALAMVPGVVAVSGTARSGGFWSGSVQAPYVALAAPAEDVVNVGARNIHNTGYSSGSGTSESAAIVSGVAALIRAEFPDLDANNVINRLIRTSVDEGAPGRDRQYGFGVVDAQRAVTADVPPTTSNPLGSSATPTPGGAGSGSATDDDAAAGRLLTLVGVGLAVLVGLVILVVVIVLIARAGRRRPPTAAPSRGPAGPPQYQQPPYQQPPYQQPPAYQPQPPPYQPSQYQQPSQYPPPSGYPPPGQQQPPYQTGPPQYQPPSAPPGWQPPPRP
jgi:subtilisin family serine protease